MIMFGITKAFRQAQRVLDGALSSVERKLDDIGTCEQCGHFADDEPLTALDDCLCDDPRCVCNPLTNDGGV
jgi:hypothetical protein